MTKVQCYGNIPMLSRAEKTCQHRHRTEGIIRHSPDPSLSKAYYPPPPPKKCLIHCILLISSQCLDLRTFRNLFTGPGSWPDESISCNVHGSDVC